MKQILALVRPSDADRVREALYVQGWAATVVGDPQEAWKAVVATRPDVVVLDSELEPGKALPDCPRAVVLADPDVLARAPRAGDVVLWKPFSARELNLAVRHCLAHRYPCLWTAEDPEPRESDSGSLLVN